MNVSRSFFWKSRNCTSNRTHWGTVPRASALQNMHFAFFAKCITGEETDWHFLHEIPNDGNSNNKNDASGAAKSVQIQDDNNNNGSNNNKQVGDTGNSQKKKVAIYSVPPTIHAPYLSDERKLRNFGEIFSFFIIS